MDSVRTRTVGRVSMNMLAVDLTGIESAKVGSKWCSRGQSSPGVVLSIDDVAVSSGTVGDERCVPSPPVFNLLIRYKEIECLIQIYKKINTNEVMSAVTVFNKVVYLSGQVPKRYRADVAGQTREILATIDELLALANTDKSPPLSAQLYLKKSF